MDRGRPTETRARAPRLADRALLLRRFPYGESSLVVHALTPEHGRVSFLAKGAYRPNSGFFAVLDLFDTLELRWSARPGQELGLLIAASLHTRRTALPADLARYRAGHGLLELAALAGREGHEERALFAWLEGALDLLQRGAAEVGVVCCAADLAFLAMAGLAPALDRCASCGRRPEEAGERGAKTAFSRASGGRLCPPCAAEARARGRAVESLPLNLLRVAASLMSATPPMLEHMRVEPGLLERVRAFAERFLEYHLETRLRSRRSAPTHP